MFCDKCGKQIPDDSDFCQYCGAPMGMVSEHVSSEKEDTESIHENLKHWKVLAQERSERIRHRSKVLCAVLIPVAITMIAVIVVVIIYNKNYYDDFKYSVGEFIGVEYGAIIERYLGNDANVKIPEKIHGVTVKSIGTEAFRGNETVENIYIPDSVINIGCRAFWDCNNLKKVRMSENVYYYGDKTSHRTLWDIMDYYEQLYGNDFYVIEYDLRPWIISWKKWQEDNSPFNNSFSLEYKDEILTSGADFYDRLYHINKADNLSQQIEEDSTSKSSSPMVETNPEPIYKYAQDVLNLRESPSTSSTLLFTVSKGTKLIVYLGTETYADGYTWIQGEYNNRAVWVSTGYLDDFAPSLGAGGMSAVDWLGRDISVAIAIYGDYHHSSVGGSQTYDFNGFVMFTDYINPKGYGTITNIYVSNFNFPLTSDNSHNGIYHGMTYDELSDIISCTPLYLADLTGEYYSNELNSECYIGFYFDNTKTLQECRISNR